MKLVAVVSIALVLAACAFTGATLRDVGILEYGRFEKPEPAGNTNNVVVDAKMIEQTTEIPAVLGTSFGLRVKYIGAPNGAPITGTAKCLHPKITDPDSGRTSESDQWETAGIIGRDGFIGYRFDKAWELVPGTWTIQVFVGSKLRAEKTFIVKAAAEEPSPPPTGST